MACQSKACEPPQNEILADERAEAGEARNPKRAKRRQPRKLRKLSQDYFRRAALYYLERYNGSQGTLRQVLRRRVMRAEREGQEFERDEVYAWIEAVIQELVQQGFLDDARFALTRARSLFDRGQSVSAIRMKLRTKGVGSAEIDAAMERLTEEQGKDGEQDLALEAARAYARKRGLGWHRQDPEQRAARAQKDLAALARRGFGYAVGKQVLEEGLGDGEVLGDLPDDWDF
jgi:regulatory protein